VKAASRVEAELDVLRLVEGRLDKQSRAGGLPGFGVGETGLLPDEVPLDVKRVLADREAVAALGTADQSLKWS
jgi:hypothetical protein